MHMQRPSDAQRTVRTDQPATNQRAELHKARSRVA
jgi:hypothetical protein